MPEFFDALLNHAFLRYALAAGVLASIGCGVMGTYVVVRRISFLAGGIAHAVLGGMGAAYFLGYAPMYGALAAAVLIALVVGWINLRFREQEDTLVAALWSTGMALGIIFIARTPGYSLDLMSYLFGNILMAAPESVYLMVMLDVVILVTVTLFYRQFQAVVFDEEFARLRGVRVELVYLLLLVMVAVTVVLLIQVVGLILVIALLTLPAAIAGHFAASLGRMMVLATAFGLVFALAGLGLSYEADLPSGATIILLAGLGYFLSTFAQRWLRSRRMAASAADAKARGTLKE
ncbi:MAG: metal ABC transporter permease [Pseudomonadota bacterium]